MTKIARKLNDKEEERTHNMLYIPYFFAAGATQKNP